MSRWGRWSANVALLAGALVATEVALQVAANSSKHAERLFMHPKERDVPVLFDPVLLYRGNPAKLDHDPHGFRNAAVLERADIVTLGDSHTYGVGVERKDAWPQLLAEKLGHSVYNFGLGGWGPARSATQLGEVRRLQPRLIVEGVYLGNDLMDAFILSRTVPALLEGISPALVAAAEAREKELSFGEKIELFARRGAPLEAPDDVPVLSRVSRMRDWVSHHSKLYGLARAARHAVRLEDQRPILLRRDFDTAAGSLDERDLEYCSAFDDGHWRTIFTAPYREFGLDRDDPRVQVGYEIMLEALLHARATADESKARFTVVLLPTKELVFAPRVERPEDHVGLAALIEQEMFLRDRLVADLERRGIAVLDPLARLRGAAEQPYFHDADGHPNELGHRLIAEEIVAEVGAVAWR